MRKKIVHLISKINLPQQKDNKLKKRVTKWGIELDKKKFNFALLNCVGE